MEFNLPIVRIIHPAEALMVPVTSFMGIPSPFTPVHKAFKLGAAIVAVDGDWFVTQVTDVIIYLAYRTDDPLPVLLALAFKSLASRIPTSILKSVPDVVAARDSATAPAKLLVVDLVAVP